MAKLTISNADLAGLKDKVIVVTGGSSGIGLETVKKFISLGAKVVNGDLQPPTTDVCTDNLHFVPVNVTSWEQLSTLFEKTIELCGRIDHVFANAGVGPTTNFLDDEKFNESGKLLEPDYRTIDINLKAAINTTYLALHYMKKQENGGSVVITASASSFQHFRCTDYGVSKHGVLGLMRGLVPITYPTLPIRVNVVAPDWTASGIVTPEFVDLINSIGGVTQEPEVVARSVALLMADGSRHGQMIFSRGGEYQELEEVLLGAADSALVGLHTDKVLAASLDASVVAK